MKATILQTLRTLHNDESGQDLVEYTSPSINLVLWASQVPKSRLGKPASER